MRDAWSGNWYMRVKQRAREYGFDTVTAFADSRPSALLAELAELLGKDDVAVVQIERILVDEAQATGTIEHCARDLLVRRLRKWLPEGWHSTWDNGSLGSAFRRAAAYGEWCAAFPDRYEKNYDRVWDSLITLSIPEGWLPSSPDDPFLIEAFRHWNSPE